MKTTHLRQALDILVTVAIGTAAVMVIWRTAAPSGAQPPRAQRAPVDDVSSANLATNIADAPIKGNSSARVVIIEFSDFECPFCKRHSDYTFDKIERELITTGKVQYAFRNLPLDKHPNAVPAAHAAECAAGQGRFWALRRHLFVHQSELGQAIWRRDAEQLGIDGRLLDECLSHNNQERIRTDLAEGARLGAKATPTFLVGRVEKEGSKTVRIMRKIEGAVPFDVFRDTVEQVLTN